MKKAMIAILTCGILLLCVGSSYSYFTGKVNGEDKELLISSKNVRILFTDSKEIANNEIEPGWSERKTFSVKNESNGSFNYNIVFENLVNTFVTEGFLQYKITSTSGYNMTGYLDIPKSNAPKTVVLAYDIDLPVDTTHEYTIEFVYHNSETVDQSEDMGKIFEGNLAIIEGSANPDIKYTVTMNSDNGTINPTSNQAIKYENLEFEVTPTTGYDINSMSVSCDPVANTVVTGNKIRVNDIRQSHNCEVSFDKETYTVNIVVNNGKSDALNKVVEYGESGTATITPNYGYTLSGATAEGTGCSIENGILTISNVQSNETCTVNLPRAKYSVMLAGTGIASSNSPQEAEYEGSTTINFTLSEGYELGSNIINCDNGEPSISGNTLTVSEVVANTTCTLSPVLKSYEVTLKVVGGTPESETKSITHNGIGTYTIANSTGYKLELDGSISCTGNAVGSLNGNVVTINNVTTTQECTINLKKRTYSVSVGVNNSGWGIVSPASSTVNHGDNLTVTIIPKSGYKYSSNTCELTVTNNQMSFNNITGDKNCAVQFAINENLLVNKIKTAYPPKSEDRPDFTKIYDGTPGLYTGNDDYGTTYYFSGDGSSMNNWVSFAGSKWRIIRINGNGSVRLLYDGHALRGAFNDPPNHPAYVGWKYTYNVNSTGVDVDRGNSTVSTIYQAIKQWYDTNIDKNYIDENAIYCNDRDITEGEYSLGNCFDYSGKTRLSKKEKPKFYCNSRDQFRDGFGLMTADEVVFAGGLYETGNTKAYYYLNNEVWWTMTPSNSEWGVNYGVHLFIVWSSAYSGKLSYGLSSNNSTYIRPVISLKKEVLVASGDGSSSNPYVIQMP